MNSNFHVFYRFCWGIAVGYFIVHPLVHNNYSHRYDDIKKLFGVKIDSTHKSSTKNELSNLDELTLKAFKNEYGDDSGSEKYKLYKHYNNYSNQLNPNNDAYWKSRGYDTKQNNDNNNSEYSQAELDNRSNQLNPNNDSYNQSRSNDNSSNSSSNQSANDNHSNQMNPNNSAYSSSRGK